jgi:hypothetical protein
LLRSVAVASAVLTASRVICVQVLGSSAMSGWTSSAGVRPR